MEGQDHQRPDPESRWKTRSVDARTSGSVLPQWVEQIKALGLVKTIIPEGYRETDSSTATWLGKLFRIHDQQTVKGETEDKRLTLKLEYKRFRKGGGEAKWWCQFKGVSEEELPEDDPPEDLPEPPAVPSQYPY